MLGSQKGKRKGKRSGERCQDALKRPCLAQPEVSKARLRKCGCKSTGCPDPAGFGPQIICHPKKNQPLDQRNAAKREGDMWVALAFAKGKTAQAAGLALVASQPVRLSAGHWHPEHLHLHGQHGSVRVHNNPGTGQRYLPINANGGDSTAAAFASIAEILAYPTTLPRKQKKARSKAGRLRCECAAGEAGCPNDLRQAGAKVGTFEPAWARAQDAASIHDAWHCVWNVLQPTDAAAARACAANTMPLAIHHYRQDQLGRQSCQGGGRWRPGAHEQWYVWLCRDATFPAL